MKKSFLKAAALGAAMSFLVATSGFAAGGSIVTGNVSLYKGGELVSTLSGQNPIEDGVLFTCKGRCIVKSEGISLIGNDGAKIAVDSADDSFNLYIKEGKVDYTITNNSRAITFITPDGAYSVADAIFDAASQAIVKGSVFIDANGATQITVSEGKLVFATANGMQAISAGDKIILAVNPGIGAAAGAASSSGAAAGAGAAAAGTAAGAGAATAGAAAAGAAGAAAAGTAAAAAGIAGATIAGVSVTTLAVGGAVIAGGAAVATAVDNSNDDDDTPAVAQNGSKAAEEAAAAPVAAKKPAKKPSIPLSPSK